MTMVMMRVGRFVEAFCLNFVVFSSAATALAEL